MERGFLLGIAIFLALISFCHSTAAEDENDASVAKRKPLLEKLGMELYRDPFYSPYGRRRCYCGYGYGGKGPVMPWGGIPQPFGPFPPFPRGRFAPRPRPARRRGNKSSDEEE